MPLSLEERSTANAEWSRYQLTFNGSPGVKKPLQPQESFEDWCSARQGRGCVTATIHSLQTLPPIRGAGTKHWRKISESRDADAMHLVSSVPTNDRQEEFSLGQQPSMCMTHRLLCGFRSSSAVALLLASSQSLEQPINIGRKSRESATIGPVMDHKREVADRCRFSRLVQACTLGIRDGTLTELPRKRYSPVTFGPQRPHAGTKGNSRGCLLFPSFLRALSSTVCIALIGKLTLAEPLR